MEYRGFPCCKRTDGVDEVASGESKSWRHDRDQFARSSLGSEAKMRFRKDCCSLGRRGVKGSRHHYLKRFLGCVDNGYAVHDRVPYLLL